jgi:cyclase
MAEQKVQYPQPQPMKTVKITENIYMTSGGAGANTGFYTGPDSVLAIDAKMTQAAGDEFVREIAKISGRPVTRMIITHSDLDHVNGLTGFPKGMKITAQRNTRRDMEEAFRGPELDALNAYLPDDTFDCAMNFKFGPAEVCVFHFGPAHTSGDAVVLFKKEKAAFVGDLVTFGRDPLIHKAKKGSCFGLVRNLREILKLNADVFIPGHNEPCGKKEIESLIKYVEEKIEKERGLVKQGKSFEEVKEIMKVVERVLPNGRRFPSFEEAAYEEIKAGK